MSDKKYVVTIARQFGSLGRPIAKLMSKKLGVEYYDRDIVEQAAKKLNLPVSQIDELEEKVKKTSTNSEREVAPVIEPPINLFPKYNLPEEALSSVIKYNVSGFFCWRLLYAVGVPRTNLTKLPKIEFRFITIYLS